MVVAAPGARRGDEEGHGGRGGPDLPGVESQGVWRKPERQTVLAGWRPELLGGSGSLDWGQCRRRTETNSEAPTGW